MSKENLPEKINPYRLAEAGAVLHGILHVKDMQRLCMELAQDDGHVEVRIELGVDQEGVRFLRGHFEAHLMLQCQRCMESFAYEIIGDFLSGVVASEEEAKRLPDRYEPVLTDEDMLVLQDVIEDELIIALPIVPMHDQADCKVVLSNITLGPEQEEIEKENNPFKVIEILRTKRDTNRNQE